MLTAQVEPYPEVLPELKQVYPQHWAELALNKDKVPLAPMWEVYEARDRAGELLLVTLRERGELAGYFLGFIAPGLHYRTCLTCTMDIFFVRPEFRATHPMAGRTLFRFAEKELKRRGVNRWFVGSKEHRDASRLFEALGFEKVETYYSMWLGD